MLQKIPEKVIQDAKGLAIFTTMRSGLWVSGAGGSGVIVARLADGSWSPPSGIMLHTAGLGFLAGIDIYDCVLVINTDKAMQAFQRLRCTVGGEVSAVAGPIGAGGMLETELHKRHAPVFTYLKSRGLYAGIQIDGTVMLERSDENERFYNERLTAQDILSGKVRHPPLELRQLTQTLKAAQGDTVDESTLPDAPPPGDYEIEEESENFGVPAKDDPDPYGVLQLEKEGMVIREAATHERATLEQFTFKPSPTSPVFDTFDRRRSKDRSSLGSRLSARSSIAPSSLADKRYSNGIEQYSQPSPRLAVSMATSSTQTDDLPPLPNSPLTSPTSPGVSSLRTSFLGTQRSSMEEIPENTVSPPSPGRSGSMSVRRHSLRQKSSLSRVLPLVANDHVPLEESREDGRYDAKRQAAPDDEHDDDDARPMNDAEHDGRQESDDDDLEHDFDTNTDDDIDDDDLEDLDDISDGEAAIVETPVVVQSVQKTLSPPVTNNKARLVTVAKRKPPVLPARNPRRAVAKSNRLDDAHEQDADIQSLDGQQEVAHKMSPDATSDVSQDATQSITQTAMQDATHDEPVSASADSPGSDDLLEDVDALPSETGGETHDVEHGSYVETEEHDTSSHDPSPHEVKGGRDDAKEIAVTQADDHLQVIDPQDAIVSNY